MKSPANCFANTQVLECARRIAEAQIDLQRIRRARVHLLGSKLDGSETRKVDDVKHDLKLDMRSLKADLKYLKSLIREFGLETPLPAEIYQPLQHLTDRDQLDVTDRDQLEGLNDRATEADDTFIRTLNAHADQLAAFDRYERRALSRRKFAIRDFDAARAELERLDVGIKT